MACALQGSQTALADPQLQFQVTRLRYDDQMAKNTKKDTENLESLPNVGRVIATKLRKIGIRTVSEFLERDPYDVFDELRTEVDPGLCRCALASIVGARYGVKWHEVTAESAREYERRNPGHHWGKC